MTKGKLANKTALITGGTSGIGLATAKRFLKEGAKVIITGRDDHHFQEACNELGDSVLALALDAGDIKQLPELVSKIKTVSNSLDILFLNAGILRTGDLTTLTETDFDAMFNLHVKGPLFSVQALSPMMPEGSSIICTTSNSCRVRVDATHIYAATKAALRQLVRSMAGELSSRGIRVNAISPGPIATNVSEGATASEEELQAIVDYTLSKVPMKRFADPDEMATVAVFLASSDASFITGAEIDADGGWAPGVSV